MPKCRRLRRTSASRGVAGAAASKRVAPRTARLPRSGRSKKFRQRSRVVLPEPEEPMMARACPSSSEKLISSSTRVAPKCFSM